MTCISNIKTKSLYFSLCNTDFLKYTVLPSIPLSILTIISLNPNFWQASEIHHFYIEMIAVILASVLSFYYISRARTLNDKFSLFIGIGFLVNALIDLQHTLVSFIFMDETTFLKYFIPQTWFAGRLFISAMFAIAISCYPILSKNEQSLSIKPLFLQIKNWLRQSPKSKSLHKNIKDKNEMENQHHQLLEKLLVICLIFIPAFTASIAISSMAVIFPAAVLDDLVLHRPYEIPSLVLFLVALVYFYKNKLYRVEDIFFKSILISLIIDIFGQIIMSFSATSFDTAHNVAHVLKDVAYFINIIGLALSSILHNVKLKEINLKLKEREETIRLQFEKLKQSERMKDEFINIAAHELKTPIQPILTLSPLIQKSLEKNDIEEVKEFVNIIDRNAKRLQKLTEDILDVTKIESQSFEMKREKFELGEVIDNLIKEYLNEIAKKEKDIKIVCPYKTNIIEETTANSKVEENSIWLNGDKSRINQVLTNLLSNALKFTDTGTVTVIVEKKRNVNNNYDEVVVKVKDNGNGVDLDIMPKVFEKFTTKSTNGTGLGLYISKNIIEAHGGRIWAENNTDGKGATFSFSLPIKSQDYQYNNTISNNYN